MLVHAHSESNEASFLNSTRRSYEITMIKSTSLFSDSEYQAVVCEWQNWQSVKLSLLASYAGSSPADCTSLFERSSKIGHRNHFSVTGDVRTEVPSFEREQHPVHY